MRGSNFKCRRCGKDGFPSPGAVRQHCKEAKHPKARKKTKVVETAEPARCAELTFMEDLVTRFDSKIAEEELDADAYNRVLAYLAQRYGSAPEAVA